MKNYTKFIIPLIALVYLGVHIKFDIWKHTETVIANDVIDYYAYVPATFIYKDLSLRFKEQLGEDLSSKIWGFKQDNGKYLIKMSLGLSILYTPFFLLAHLVALIGPAEANGYSTPYSLALIFASLFYFLAGLVFLKKFLSNFFGKNSIAITLLVIALGTNLNYYLSREAAMSHSFSFFLFSAFLFLTHKWHLNNKTKYAIFLGLIFGLISLIRPTNSLIALVFIFWNVDSFSALKFKFSLFISNKKHILLIIFFAFIVWLPQLFYWKYITGDFLHYSYNEEGFFFLKPKIFKILFSFRKGLFIYTPLMIFAFVGFYSLYKNYKALFFPTLIFTILNIYIISSWWCWWYGGSLGQRAFIESFAIFSLPLTALISAFLTKSLQYRISVYLIALAVIFHAKMQLSKYINGAIHWDSMTRLAYFETFEKVHPTYKFYELLEIPDYQNALKGLPENIIPMVLPDNKTENKINFNSQVFVIDYLNFENINDQQKADFGHYITNKVSRTATKSLSLSSEKIYRPAFENVVSKFDIKNSQAIFAEVYFYPTEMPESNSLGIVISFEYNSNILKYDFKSINKEELKINEWNLIFAGVEIPDDLVDDVIIKVYLWNVDGQTKGYVDDFRVVLLKR